jgi:hypothetical protein
MTPSDLGNRLFDPEAALECADATDTWDVPGFLHAADGVLIWNQGDAEHPGHRVHVGHKLLEDFARLGTADDRLIEAYARRWGPLLICEHNLPSSHRHTEPHRVADGLVWVRCDLLEIEVGGEYYCYWEPLDVWRQYAEIAQATLTIAGDLYNGGTGEVNDWRVVLGLGHDEPVSGPLQSRWHGWFFLSSVVNHWLLLAGVRPTLCLSEKITIITLGNGSLFAALATQLLLVVGRRRGLAICSSCGTFYTPERRPAANRRRYCDECGPSAARRDASADYRARQRQANEVGRP